VLELILKAESPSPPEVGFKKANIVPLSSVKHRLPFGYPGVRVIRLPNDVLLSSAVVAIAFPHKFGPVGHSGVSP